MPALVQHQTFDLPWFASRAERHGTSNHPLILGASPGTTGTMSLYRALVMLGVSVVHYSQSFNATSGLESNTYDRVPAGGPVPLLRPLFAATHPAPPVDLDAARTVDLRFLAETDALIDTPAQEIFFDVLATFPRARVIVTARDPLEWAISRRARHPTDRVPLLPLLGLDVPMGALSGPQAAAALALWHKAVAASVPPERLLVLDLFNMSSSELWRKLCVFLGRPLPVREPSESNETSDDRLPPFPHEQYGADVVRHLLEQQQERRPGEVAAAGPTSTPAPQRLHKLSVEAQGRASERAPEPRESVR